MEPGLRATASHEIDVAFWEGRVESAVRDLERDLAQNGSTWETGLGYGYARLGREEEARRIIRDREARGLTSADIWMGLGEVDRGLRELEEELDSRPVHPRCDRPWYPEYEHDPRLIEILAKDFPES